VKRTDKAPKPAGRKLRLRPANSFDLIRLIAHGQSDARKAVAELVQNALDAHARAVTITRQRRRGELVLAIMDDGSGVFPELERDEALERLATNIGHSFKRNLSAAERQAQMLLGKYGIGLLGFWSVGREFEMRTRVAASDVWCLRLQRDEPDAEVRRLAQSRIPLGGETWTEVVIRGVHPAPARQLSGRRLGEYLGSELRGQLLAREVKLRVLDKVARGTAVKDFLVVPQRFQGRRIRGLVRVEVPGHADAVLELHLVGEGDGRHGQVALSSGGSVVADDLGAIDGYSLDASLWSSGRLEGIVEFPALDVAPTTRRGFAPTPAAEALFAALRSVEPRLREILSEESARRELEEDESLAQELRRIFRPLSETLPQYDFFDLGREGEGERRERGKEKGALLGRQEGDGAPVPPPADEPTSEVVDAGGEPGPPDEILPPGPLASVRIAPRKCRLLPGASRLLVATALDETGHAIREGVDLSWKLLAGEASLTGEGDRVTLTASEHLGTVRVGVEARQGERSAAAAADVEVVEKLRGEKTDAGIPDPERVFDPAGDWRSRVSGRRWEYNAAHPDYQAVVEDSKRRLRYLTHLFAKEIVLRNYGEPKDERLLERMVEVLTHIRRGV
jgi:hypothetical protein